MSSYIINNSRGNIIAVIPDGSTNTSATSLSLIGQGVTNYGTAENENLVYLLENFANSTAPTTPILGQLWYNSSTDVLYSYSSANIWVELATAAYVQAQKISPIFTGIPTAPTAANGTSTTQLATTAFVINQLSGSGGIDTPGPIIAGPITSSGDIVAGGNFTAAGANFSGSITSAAIVALGTVTGGNLVTSGLISATGNITGQNLSTGGNIQATGNITGANFISLGLISAAGTVTGVQFTGSGSGLTSIPGSNIIGTLSASTTGHAATVSAAAQANITSVGTLTSLTVTGNIDAGNISATHLTGTLSTAAQPSITSTGTLTSLTVTGNVSATTFTGALTGTATNATSATSATSATTAGTVTTAAQPSITSVGTLTSLSISGNVTAGNISTAGELSAGTVVTAALSTASTMYIQAAQSIQIIGGGAFRLPTLTTGQRNSLSASNGDLIYNTSEDYVQCYQANAWVNMTQARYN